MSRHEKPGRLTTLTKKLPRTRPQLVTAVIAAGAALVLAPGTYAQAAGYITSSDIKNQTIRSRDIGAERVGTSEVRNQSLRSRDIGSEGVGTSEIRDGNVTEGDLSDGVRQKIEEGDAQGPKGDKGEPGKDGEDGKDGKDGKDGVSGYEVIGRTADARTVHGGEVMTITTKCADGEVALGGGMKANGSLVEMLGSYPDGVEQVSEPDADDPAGRWGADGWAVKVRNTQTDKDATVQPYVVCAKVSL